MARDPRLAALRRALFTRRTGWQLAAALALLGLLLGGQRLGGHRLTRAADLVGHALAQAARLVLDAGWLLLLLAAAGLALGLAVPTPARGTVVRRLPTLATSLARWLLGGAAVLAVLVLVVVVLPPRFTASRHFNTTAEELKAQNDVRTTLLQALAGALLATGAYLTWRQLRVTREGQITDRYTKAVDQLGSEHLDVRVGGIYALERIARNSPPDRATIEEVLTAFVRDHAPWPLPPAAPAQPAVTQQPTTAVAPQPPSTASPTAGRGTDGQPDEKRAEPQGPSADVQAALTVLGRRRLPPHGLRQLDLSRVDLQRASLEGANLQKAWLRSANLQGAQLAAANLQGAVLNAANIRDANLGGANLRDAWLNGAILWGAFLRDANLQGARIAAADLRKAGLGGANLRGAGPGGAQLAAANLQGAQGLEYADLKGAIADKDTRWPGWDRAQAESRGVRYSD